MPAGDQLPITDIGIIADIKRLPNGYDGLFRSADAGDDCDLWKDSLFRSVPRYLCVTRKAQLNGSDDVLADITIVEERTTLPKDYKIIEKTMDTGEKATKKRCIAVKFVPRAFTSNAICELIFLSMKSRKANVGYTMVGQINHLTLCFKMGAVSSSSPDLLAAPAVISQSISSSSLPPTDASSPVSGAMMEYRSAGSTPVVHGPHVPPKPSQFVVNEALMRMSVNDSMTVHHRDALDSVQFRINPQLMQLKDTRGLHLVDVSFRSLVDIENEYSYSFADEYSAIEYQR